MEILITGATGFLARHLIPALQDRGDTVRALALPTENIAWLQHRDVTTYRGDVRHPQTLAQPMRGVDAVFHTAAMMGVWRPMEAYYEVNVTGTENVCRAALTARVQKLIHVSSWTVYGMGIDRPASEKSPLAPLHEPHVFTKAEGDRLVQRMITEHGLPAVIVRPGTFIGPGDRLHFERSADRLRAGKGLIVGSGRNALPFVNVADVVQGLLLALDQPRALGQIYNITTDEPMTQEEFLRATAEAVGANPRWLHVPYHSLYTAAVVAERVAKLTRMRRPLLTRLGVALFGTSNRHAIDKARTDLGYSPAVPMLEGIQRAAAWYRQERLSVRIPVPAASA